MFWNAGNFPRKLSTDSSVSVVLGVRTSTMLASFLSVWMLFSKGCIIPQSISALCGPALRAALPSDSERLLLCVHA